VSHSGEKHELLLLAIGNDGRSDDGLGWAFGRRMEAEATFNGDVEYRFQLQVEDALLAADYELVLFVDASRKAVPGGFDCVRCHPVERAAFTTHFLAPPAVLRLCCDLYDATPAAYILRIQGEHWDLEIGLSARARQRLDHAVEWMLQRLPVFDSHDQS